MKNPMAIMAALALGFGEVLTGKKEAVFGYSRAPHAHGYGKNRYRKSIHAELPKGASYNKAMLRCQARSRKPDWAVPS